MGCAFDIFMAVLFASTLPVVAPVTMRTSISFYSLAHDAVEPVRLGSAGCLDEDLEFLFRGRDISPATSAQQGSELFLDPSHRLQCGGRIIRCEDLRQAVRSPHE